jgi:hypothetical protein
LKQGNLFGPIHPEARRTGSRSRGYGSKRPKPHLFGESRILGKIQISVLPQPFEMPVNWDIVYADLATNPGIIRVNQLIAKGPLKARRGTFQTSWYRFLRLLTAPRRPQIEAELAGTEFRQTWFPEAVALVPRLPVLSIGTRIWALDAEFADEDDRPGIVPVMWEYKGWYIELAHPSLGEMKVGDLILVHCNFV